MPLAVDRDELFQLTRQVQLTVGDVLLLVTDGVAETRNSVGELFGSERTLDVGRRNVEKRAGDMVHLIYEEVTGFAGGRAQDDDITILVAKVVER